MTTLFNQSVISFLITVCFHSIKKFLIRILCFQKRIHSDFYKDTRNIPFVFQQCMELLNQTFSIFNHFSTILSRRLEGQRGGVKCEVQLQTFDYLCGAREVKYASCMIYRDVGTGLEKGVWHGNIATRRKQKEASWSEGFLSSLPYFSRFPKNRFIYCSSMEDKTWVFCVKLHFGLKFQSIMHYQG